MYFISLLPFFAFVYIKCEECDKLGTLLYEDLGCKPRSVDRKPCPTQFDCQGFKKSNESCFFQSQEIPIGASINDSFTYSSCHVGCRCVYDEHKKMADFTCAVLDCEEFAIEPTNCYFTHTPGKCCATGEICSPYDNITTCVVEGTEYLEGQPFYPSNTCLSCVCLPGFDGKFEEPFCKKRTCGAQIDNSEKLAENCAPVYFDSEILCCPLEWVCSSGDEKIKQINSKSASNSDLTCKWGKQSLKLGEGLETRIEHFDEMRNVTCECVLPPLLMCKETKK